MIVEKHVDVRINNSNSEHFLKLGYISSPSFRGTIAALTTDLPEYSHVVVTCICGICGRAVDLPKAKYTRSLKVKGRYECCNCGRNIPRLTQESVDKEFSDRGLVLLTSYKNNKQALTFTCINHPAAGEQRIALGDLKKGGGCRLCNTTHRWVYKIKAEADLSTLQYLRRLTDPWRLTYKNLLNSTCVITKIKSPYNHIHHLEKPFKMIVTDFFVDYSACFDWRENVVEYSSSELDIIKFLFLDYHEHYGIGVCLTPEMHMKFHSKFGKGFNTDDFIEFWREERLA